MTEKPLAVAIAALIEDNKILLIKRTRGDYVGLWGLPGGKIEKGEHFSQAAKREIWEETEIKSEFNEYLGFVSEHLIENGNIVQHFLLHICLLLPLMSRRSPEAETAAEWILKERQEMLKWFNLDLVKDVKGIIIPSDFLMIEKMILGREKNYYECVIEKLGDEHILRKFE